MDDPLVALNWGLLMMLLLVLSLVLPFSRGFNKNFKIFLSGRKNPSTGKVPVKTHLFNSFADPDFLLKILFYYYL